MVTAQARRHNVYPDLLRQNRMFRVSKNTELSIEEIHHHFFNSWMAQKIYRNKVSVGYSLKWATNNIWKNCAFF